MPNPQECCCHLWCTYALSRFCVIHPICGGCVGGVRPNGWQVGRRGGRFFITMQLPSVPRHQRMHVGAIQSCPQSSVDAALPSFSWRLRKKNCILVRAFGFGFASARAIGQHRASQLSHVTGFQPGCKQPALCALPPPLRCFGARTPPCKFQSQLIQPPQIHAVIVAEPATTRVRIRLFGAPLAESLLSLSLSLSRPRIRRLNCAFPLLEADTRISAFFAVTPSLFPQQPDRDVIHGSECLDGE